MQASSRQMIDQQDLAQEIASFCTASTADVMLILESLATIVPHMDIPVMLTPLFRAY